MSVLFSKDSINRQIKSLFDIQVGDIFTFEFDYYVHHGIVFIIRKESPGIKTHYIRRYRNVASSILEGYNPSVVYRSSDMKKSIIFRFVATGNRDAFMISKLLNMRVDTVEKYIRLNVKRYDALLMVTKILRDKNFSVNEISDMYRFAYENDQRIYKEVRKMR